MVVEMIASHLPSVITRQLDWWYYRGKTAKITTGNFRRCMVVGRDNGVKAIFISGPLRN